MRVLVACEFSGVVRDAFQRRGHDAWSCDLLPTESPGQHIQGDLFKAIPHWDFDLIIAHPPCTHLSSSGARHFAAKISDGRQDHGINFFLSIAGLSCPRMAIENPIGIMSTRWRKPDQIIQPWMFGHSESKATCLWLKNLPKLIPTQIMTPEWKKKRSEAAKKDTNRISMRNPVSVADSTNNLSWPAPYCPPKEF